MNRFDWMVILIWLTYGGFYLFWENFPITSKRFWGTVWRMFVVGVLIMFVYIFAISPLSPHLTEAYAVSGRGSLYWQGLSFLAHVPKLKNLNVAEFVKLDPRNYFLLHQDTEGRSHVVHLGYGYTGLAYGYDRESGSWWGTKEVAFPISPRFNPSELLRSEKCQCVLLLVEDTYEECLTIGYIPTKWRNEVDLLTTRLVERERWEVVKLASDGFFATNPDGQMYLCTVSENYEYTCSPGGFGEW